MIENRKSFRLPFRTKILLANNEKVLTGNTANISAGGIYLMTLDPLPRDSKCKVVFQIDPEQAPVVTYGIVKRVLAATPNVEDTPGLGLEFVGADSNDLARIQAFMQDDRKNFELLSTLLSSGEPDLSSIAPLMRKMHIPAYSDLGELRFYVERILQMIELVDKANTQPST